MSDIPWWMSVQIDDNKLLINSVDNRVVFSYDDCGDIPKELLPFAFDVDKKIVFPRIVSNNNSFLSTQIQVIKKDTENQFYDLRKSVKTYRYLPNLLLSLGFITRPQNIDDDLKFELFQTHFIDNTGTLEYYLLNNTQIIIKKRNYFDGLIELSFYRLLQEMYRYALLGNQNCNWMLAFDTPMQIWFIAQSQIALLKWYKSAKSSRDALKNINTALARDCVIIHNQLQSLYMKKSNLALIEALGFTIAQMIINPSPTIQSTYTAYLNTVKKQSNALRKGQYEQL